MDVVEDVPTSNDAAIREEVALLDAELQQEARDQTAEFAEGDYSSIVTEDAEFAVVETAGESQMMDGEILEAMPQLDDLFAAATAVQAAATTVTAEKVLMEQSVLQQALDGFPFGGGGGDEGSTNAAARLVELAKARIAGRARVAAAGQLPADEGDVEAAVQLLMLADAEVAAEGLQLLIQYVC